jgi:predicted porin
MKVIRSAALSAAVATLCPNAANAQSSVTLYGLLDNGIGFVKTASGNQYGAFTGNINGDRWGMRGHEDLGGGLAALFQLESGFSIDNGTLRQGGREFGRQAIVGLASERWGSLTLGRQYDAVVDVVQPLTADALFGSAFTTPGDVDNYDNTLRVSNGVKFTTPILYGLKAEIMYGFGGIAGQTGEAQTWSAGLSYVHGPFALGGGYFYANNAPAAAATRTAWTSTSTDSLFGSPINDGYQSAHSLTIARIGGQYKTDRYGFGASYSNVQLRRDAASVFTEDEHFNSISAYGNFSPVQNILVALGYTFLKAGGDTSATYHQVSFGTDYRLSKRTGIYGLAIWQHASGTQRTASGGLRDAAASVGSYGFVGTSTQELLMIGMRHRF